VENLITRKSSEFYSKLQRYKFIDPDTDEVDPREWDIDDILTNGVPTNDMGADLELYAIIKEEN
jgi:hypothetical protein